MDAKIPTTEQGDEPATLTMAELHPLVSALASHDAVVRDQARQTLVAMGTPAVDQLIAALQSPRHELRWEAAKALGEIADPRAAPALIAALEDVRYDVRWLAAVGLIALRESGLIPLLQTLEHASWSEGNLRAGAHHVLRAQLGGPYATALAPVVAALEGPESSLTTPLAAYRALGALRDTQG
ncbi:MAG: HEAT repeat domain-containing protein [Chloroflexales bacterium]|nr:HEAT repeat domain-containing protein [Chloroflexales bacterium]